MSIQAYDADMVEKPGAEALASGALANLWAAMGRIWPLWSCLTLVCVLRAGTAAVQTSATATALQTGVGQLAAAAVQNLAAGLVTGIAIRVMLGRGREAWRPDGGLLAYAGIVAALASIPDVVASMIQIPAPGAAPALLTSHAGVTALVLAATVAAALAGLRLTLWPIGRLIGDAEMTPARSWRLMRGLVLRYAMAAILLGAPVLILNFIVIMLTRAQNPLLSNVAAAPLGSLMALLAAAVATEVYRMRVVVVGPEAAH
jgi:hypothetical protein